MKITSPIIIASLFAGFAAASVSSCTKPGSSGPGTGGSSMAGSSGGGAVGSGGSPGAGGDASGVAGSGSGVAGSGSGVAGSGSGVAGSGSGVAGSGAGGSGVAGSGSGGSGTGGSAALPFPTQACIDKANSILATMTLDEKALQTIQSERAQTSNAQVTQYAPGSIYSQGGSAPSTNTPQGWADMINGYRAASRTSAHKIPIIYGLDSVHGLGPVANATIFPHNIGLGATNDPALVQQVAAAIADESAGVGADFPFAPVIAVGRDEHWGRTYETFGETPDLVSKMGVAMIKGLQFPTGGTKISILANPKHFLGDGGTAGGITGANTAGDEATLRALHLAPYQAAVAARAGSVMLSYSSWQGTKMHFNKTMITDVLKGQLGFGGFVVTDYNGCAQGGMNFHDGMAACLNAGADMFMIFSGGNGVPTAFGTSGTTVQSTITGLVTANTVPQARLDDAVRRILAVKCEMGLFDTTGVIDTAATARVGSAAHRMLARQAVQKSIVVLKNTNNLLPLSKTAKVALAGNSAQNSGNQCGGWTITWQGQSGDVIVGATSIRTAMEAEVGASNVVYSSNGSTTTGATVGVAVIGETPYSEGSGDIGQSGHPDLNVPNASSVMALKAAGIPVVVVLIVGRPMILDPILQYADAIVVAWLPGSEGAGVTDILYGDVKPTGKLPVSWPRSASQVPINQGDATYDPLFAYGFGLTY